MASKPSSVASWDRVISSSRKFLKYPNSKYTEINGFYSKLKGNSLDARVGVLNDLNSKKPKSNTFLTARCLILQLSTIGLQTFLAVWIYTAPFWYLWYGMG